MAFVRFNNGIHPGSTNMDQWMKEVFGAQAKPEAKKTIHPRTDIWEDENSFTLELAMAGIGKEDIRIDIDDQVLKVSGERKFEKREGATYHRIQTRHGSFEQSFKLPEVVDVESISAGFENGILTLTLPKREESKPKKLQIEVS